MLKSFHFHSQLNLMGLERFPFFAYLNIFQFDWNFKFKLFLTLVCSSSSSYYDGCNCKKIRLSGSLNIHNFIIRLGLFSFLSFFLPLMYTAYLYDFM